MIKYIPTFTDITDWSINVHQSTGGTRSKSIAIEPGTGNQYFIKGSKETSTGEIRYPTEFWSEIVASKIGSSLGFQMLDYNIGYNNNAHKQKIGCLSKSMIVSGENKLTEGLNYLVGYDGSYRPDVAEHKKRYTFDFITSALSYFSMSQYIEKIIETIIFDCIVGNSDRHQENWGVITNFVSQATETSAKEDNFLAKLTNIIIQLKSNIARVTNFTGSNLNSSFLGLETRHLPHEFAPIYDSGCCLGREIQDQKIDKMLTDSQMTEAYVRKGLSEIHDKNLKKSNHFDLIRSIKTNHSHHVLSVIQRTEQKFDLESIRALVFNIDKELPTWLPEHKLEKRRKELMVKLITLRTQALFNIL